MPDTPPVAPRATPALVATRYRGDLAGLDDVVGTLLLDAAAQVDLGRDIPARIAGGRTSTRLVAQVEAEMVAAVLRNPDAVTYRSTSDTAGPSTVVESASLDAEAASGLLRITRAQRRLLGDRLGGIASVAPGSATAGVQPYGPAAGVYR